MNQGSADSCLEDEFVLADLDGELLADFMVLGDVCEGSIRERVRVARWEGWVPLPLSRNLRAGKVHVPFWILLRALAWDSRSRCISRTAAGAGANDDAMVCRCFLRRRRLRAWGCKCRCGVVFSVSGFGLFVASALPETAWRATKLS